MARKADGDFRLDVLIKKEGDYYSAHCLQFDLVVTDDTVEAVQRAMIDCIIAHVRFAIDNDNMKCLYSPAPQEVWNEYARLATGGEHICEIVVKPISIPKMERQSPFLLPFKMQEVVCHA